jgi:predicted AlkP superfamily pyrophosphatase or phosphodiesterase
MGKNSSARPLIVVSLDGVRPDICRGAGELGIRLLNIQELMDSGASATAVESVYPSTTYPAHATLVTGVPPRLHGIFSHLTSLDPTEKARAWHWFAQPLRVPALWNSAHAMGLKTAAVGWPVSAGAPIDFNVPEIWDPAHPHPLQDFQTVARHSTPGLFEELMPAVAPMLSIGGASDRLRTEAALSIWNRYHPNLLLLHLVEYDYEAHRTGPLAREALEALERSDAELARLREAAADTGPANFVVLSDHGFVPVEKEAAPLVVLGDEGLFIKVNEAGWELRRLGAVHAGGSLALYWLEKPSAEDRRALDRALDRLKATGAVGEIVDRAKLETLSADPDAEMMLDAAPGFYFSDRFDGPVVRPSLKDRGTHGHLPTRQGLEAMFVAAGPEVAPGKNLGRLTLVQVARALIHLAGLPPDTLAPDFEPINLG